MTRWFLVSMLTLVCLPGWALRTGDIQTQSRLNEPLEAVLSIRDVSATDAANLQVRVASDDIYAQLGLERSVAANDLRFAIEGEAPDNLRIRVRGQRPWVEPYVILVLDIATSSGRLLREYTLLLDPAQAAPSLIAQQPVESVPATVPAPAVAATPAVSPAPATAQRSAAREAASPGAPRSVDTAADRRTAVPPPTVSGLAPAQSSIGNSPIVETSDRPVDTMATVGNQPIVRGAQPSEDLRVRPGANLFAIATEIAQSRGVGVSQAAWALYENNPKAFAGSPDQLLRGARLQVPTNAQIRASSEAQARAKLKNAAQGAALAAAPVTPQPRELTRSEPRVLSTPVPTPRTQVVPSPVATTAPQAAQTPPAAAADDDAVAAANSADDAESLASESDGLLEESFLDESADTPVDSAPMRPEPASTLAKQPLWMWIAGAAVLVLLLILVLRRRRSGKDGESATPLAPQADGVGPARPMDDAFAPQSRAAGPEDEAASMESVSLDAAPLTDTADDGFSALDAEGAADPLAEADFHIAYGLYDEAERVLLQAREAEPERDDIIEKLAETYYASGNTQAFEALAQEVQQERPGSAAWARIREWGSQLIPGAAMFASSSGADSALTDELDSLDLPESDSLTAESFSQTASDHALPDALDTGVAEGEPSALDTELAAAEDAVDALADEDTERAAPAPAADDNLLEFELPPSEPAPDSADAERPDAGNVIDFDMSDDGAADAVNELAKDVADAPLADATPEAEEGLAEDDLEQISLADLEADAAPDLDLADDDPVASGGDDTTPADLADGGFDDVDFALDELQGEAGDEGDFDLELESAESAAIDPESADSDSLGDELSMDAFELDDAAVADADDLELSEDKLADDAADDLGVVNHDDVVSTGDDMAGKLDLARAYIDMSELDMARSLLDEVALRGSEEQQAEAQSMLEQLG